MKAPLFPLRTVLFPGGPLPLRIFEARYIDMIGSCLRNDELFGVLLISDGAETGPASTYDIGTLARITDWYQGSDGLLGVTAIGEQRFRVISTERLDDGLNVGEIEFMPDDIDLSLPDEYEGLAHILSGVLDDLGRLYEFLERRYDDAGWVGYRFAEILPFSPEQRQACLEMNDPLERLSIVKDALDNVRGPASLRTGS